MRYCALLALLFTTAVSAQSPQIPPAVSTAPSAPEAASGFTTKQPVYAKRQMAVTAHPLASQAALDILRAGGNAVDAAIAAQLMLGLVEPQSSGIGGGAFMMSYRARDQYLTTWDGRETAPVAATPDLFMRDGKPLPFYDAVVGGRSVGTPGLLRMLQAAHQQQGRLPWAQLFTPAINAARDGFAVGPRWYTLSSQEQHLRKDAAAAQYFYGAGGQALPVGTIVKNPAYAATLAQVAQQGVEVFYNGPLGQRLVQAVQSHPTNPGLLQQTDLTAYQAVERTAVCTQWQAQPKQRLHICGFGPPGSGAIAVAQVLQMTQLHRVHQFVPQADQSKRLQWDSNAAHLVAQAARLAFADRNQYVADPGMVNVPLQGLLNPQYLQQRAQTLPDNASGQAAPGTPPQAVALGPDHTQDVPGTTHLSIMDRWGNAVSMTSTIEDQYGARMMVDGYLLNNQLTDFSFNPAGADGAPAANRVQGGKRPRSSMAPTFVFADGVGKRKGQPGQLIAVVGSPGGAHIINYVAKTLLGVFAWNLNMQQAIDLPNFGSRNLPPKGATEIEQEFASETLVQSLRARGHEVRAIPMTSGLHGIRRVRTKHGWQLEGGADPRREGVALGD